MTKEKKILSVRAKILLAIVASTLALCAAIYILSTQVLLKSYRDIERQGVTQDLRRATDAINNFSNQQLFKLRDWAQWDDSYAFARDQNTEFLVTSLVPSALANLDLNLLMFTDLNGRLVHVLAIRLPGGEEIPSDALAAEIVADGSLTTHPSLESSKTGLLMLAEGPVIVSSRPLSKTDGTGPSTGSLIFARFLDVDKVKEFGDITHLTLSVFPYAGTNVPVDVLDAKKQLSPANPYIVVPISPTSVVGYTVLNDVHGAPALIVKVEEPRPVYAQGLLTFYFYLFVGGIAIVLFSVVILSVLDRLVIARFLRLTADVEKINEDKDLSTRVTGGEQDEIGRLAEKINQMLKWLADAREGEAASRREIVNLLNDLKQEKDQKQEMAEILKIKGEGV